MEVARVPQFVDGLFHRKSYMDLYDITGCCRGIPTSENFNFLLLSIMCPESNVATGAWRGETAETSPRREADGLK